VCRSLGQHDSVFYRVEEMAHYISYFLGVRTGKLKIVTIHMVFLIREHYMLMF